MNETNTSEFTCDELAQQHTAELPNRDLLLALTVLGIPVVGVTGINISIS